MGCGSSVNTAVQPFTPPGQVKGDEDETASKHSGRGDSAVSKVTTDSGVVMENRDVHVLPGVVPRKLPPLMSVCDTESARNPTTQDGLLQQDRTAQQPLKSSEILEELFNQGIIPVDQVRESRSGESYSIMLNDGEEILRRPPARLDSLKAMKDQRVSSREESDEKLRLAEERRKLKEEELRQRLRAKSARGGRTPATVSSTAEDNDATGTPVEPLQSSDISCPTPTDSSQITNTDKSGRDDKESRGGMGRTEAKEEVEKEEETQVQELQDDKLLSDSVEVENDKSFQHPSNNDDIF